MRMILDRNRHRKVGVLLGQFPDYVVASVGGLLGNQQPEGCGARENHKRSRGH